MSEQDKQCREVVEKCDNCGSIVPIKYLENRRTPQAQLSSSDKAALIGEFRFPITLTCSACSFDSPQDDCEVCGGEVDYTEMVTVPWETIKEIHKAIAARCGDEQAVKDAKRYQWLRNSRSIHDSAPFIARNFGASFSQWTMEDADRVIDEAMQKEKQ